MIAPLRALIRPQGGIAGLWLILVIVAALFAPLLTPYTYDIQNLPNAYQPASEQHWLGTDEFGRDLLTRLVRAADRARNSWDGADARRNHRRSASQRLVYHYGATLVMRGQAK